MPTKRAVLAEFTRDELRANVDYYELQIDDRRVKAQLVEALAGSRKARVHEVLQDLSRDRLKELCRAFDLDDSGRKKADLVARLVGPTVASKSAGGVGSLAASRQGADTPDPSADTLSVAQLETYLWSAADILRGSIDSSDYKTYIFGLLFLKRLSDRFEEEAERPSPRASRRRSLGQIRTSTSSSRPRGRLAALEQFLQGVQEQRLHADGQSASGQGAVTLPARPSSAPGPTHSRARHRPGRDGACAGR